MKKISLIIGAASLLFVAGCGYQTTPTTTTTQTTTSTAKILPKDITIANFQFSPATMDIAIGETTQWINNDTMAHAILADDNSFQSVPLQAGESFSFTFAQAGTYSYHCSIHPSMKGTITVK